MSQSKTRSLIALLLALLVTPIAIAAEQLLYVGTYTGGDSQGIYLLGFDTETGKLSNKGLAAESVNPSFLAVHPDGKHIYAVNETSKGELSSFVIDPATHQLNFLNKTASGGADPCHLVVDATGKSLLVANYTGGSLSSTRIKPDGSLGRQTSFVQHEGSSVTERQKSPHAHSINLDAANRFAVAADLGKDQLIVYRFSAPTGQLAAHSVANLKPGAGPRHFAFHPDGKHAYAINELTSTVTVLEYDARQGQLRDIQTITTLPCDYTGTNSTAEIRISPNGKFVYGSNRGHDSIAVYSVEQDGRLVLAQIEPIGGKTPRNFNLDPSGKFLLAAGQNTNSINVFAINAKTGKLTKTEHSVRIPTPVCIRFTK